MKYVYNKHHVPDSQASKPMLHEQINTVIQRMKRTMETEPVLCCEFWNTLVHEFSDFQFDGDRGYYQAATIEGTSIRFYLEYRDSVMDWDPHIIRFIQFKIGDMIYSCT